MCCVHVIQREFSRTRFLTKSATFVGSVCTMSRQLAKALGSVISRLPKQQSLATSSIRCSSSVVLDQETKERIHPRIGNRDIVGFGINGSASYFDIPQMPFPAIRFRENTSDNLALREKERNDWKSLTLEEKKSLYRISFCQTYAEMYAPTGNWKRILAVVLGLCSFTGWIIIWMKMYVYPPLPHTMTKEWQEAVLKRMVATRTGPVEGVASHWDYEKGRGRD